MGDERVLGPGAEGDIERPGLTEDDMADEARPQQRQAEGQDPVPSTGEQDTTPNTDQNAGQEQQ